MATLKAQKRKKEESTQALRKKGLVPAVLYGPEEENENLAVKSKDFRSVYKKVGETSILNLKIKGQKKERPVLIKDFQIHPVSDKLLHVDFYQPVVGEKVEAMVPLVFTGVSPAVKEKDGVLVKNFSELKVSALPKNLPSEIEISVEGLEELEDNLHVKDIEVPGGVEILRDEDDIIASVITPKTTEEVIEEMERVPEEEELFVGEEEIIEEGLEEELTEEEEEEEKEEEEEGIEI